MTRLAVSTLAASAVWVLAAPAHAADPPWALPPAPVDVVANYCGDADLSCTLAALEFQKTVELPMAFDWDTGWIPGGSDLQVRFYVKVPATTTVQLAGYLETTWPEAMTLATPGGTERSGLLAFDYGIEVGGKLRFDILGIRWEGDIPYVPQVDFHLDTVRSFEAWAFAPDSTSASAFTAPVRLFEVNLLGLAGIPSAVASGGVALDLQGELRATYTTDRINIDDLSVGEEDITAKDQQVTRAFPGGAYVEYDVWPEGTVHFDGVIHLLPTAYIEVLTIGIDIPLFDFPITVPVGDQAFAFDPVRVHVPLPDITGPATQTVDFGRVSVGSGERFSVTLANVGEARALATGALTQTDDAFKLLSPQGYIDPAQNESFDVRFNPTEAGVYTATLTFVTNDPDRRLITVNLRGEASEVDRPDYPDAGPSDDGGPVDFASAAVGDDGSCGCRAPSPRGAVQPWALGVGLALLAAVRRRSLPPRISA